MKELPETPDISIQCNSSKSTSQTICASKHNTNIVYSFSHEQVNNNSHSLNALNVSTTTDQTDQNNKCEKTCTMPTFTDCNGVPHLINRSKIEEEQKQKQMQLSRYKKELHMRIEQFTHKA